MCLPASSTWKSNVFIQHATVVHLDWKVSLGNQCALESPLRGVLQLAGELASLHYCKSKSWCHCIGRFSKWWGHRIQRIVLSSVTRISHPRLFHGVTSPYSHACLNPVLQPQLKLYFSLCCSVGSFAKVSTLLAICAYHFWLRLAHGLIIRVQIKTQPVWFNIPYSFSKPSHHNDFPIVFMYCSSALMSSVATKQILHEAE